MAVTSFAFRLHADMQSNDSRLGTFLILSLNIAYAFRALWHMWNEHIGWFRCRPCHKSSVQHYCTLYLVFSFHTSTLTSLICVWKTSSEKSEAEAACDSQNSNVPGLAGYSPTHYGFWLISGDELSSSVSLFGLYPLIYQLLQSEHIQACVQVYNVST